MLATCYLIFTVCTSSVLNSSNDPENIKKSFISPTQEQKTPSTWCRWDADKTQLSRVNTIMWKDLLGRHRLPTIDAEKAENHDWRGTRPFYWLKPLEWVRNMTREPRFLILLDANLFHQSQMSRTFSSFVHFLLIEATVTNQMLRVSLRLASYLAVITSTNGENEAIKQVL